MPELPEPRHTTMRRSAACRARVVVQVAIPLSRLHGIVPTGQPQGVSGSRLLRARQCRILRCDRSARFRLSKLMFEMLARLVARRVPEHKSSYRSLFPGQHVANSKRSPASASAELRVGFRRVSSLRSAGRTFATSSRRQSEAGPNPGDAPPLVRVLRPLFRSPHRRP